MQRFPKKRIEIIAEEAVLPRLLRAIEDSGAKGHTLIESVSGQGNRGRRTVDAISGVAGNILVLVVADERIAEALIPACHEVLRNYAGVVLVSDVEVLRDQHF